MCEVSLVRPHASVRGGCHTPASSFREGGLSYPRTKQVAFLMISSSMIAVTCPWVRFFLVCPDKQFVLPTCFIFLLSSAGNDDSTDSHLPVLLSSHGGEHVLAVADAATHPLAHPAKLPPPPLSRPAPREKKKDKKSRRHSPGTLPQEKHRHGHSPTPSPPQEKIAPVPSRGDG